MKPRISLYFNAISLLKLLKDFGRKFISYQPNSNGTYPIVKPFKSELNPTPKWTLAITESLSEQREELCASSRAHQEEPVVQVPRAAVEGADDAVDGRGKAFLVGDHVVVLGCHEAGVDPLVPVGYA